MRRVVGIWLRLGLVACTVYGAPLAAQVANGSTAAEGMGGNYAAAALGYETVSWNPAMLGLPGNPRVSATLLSGLVSQGVNPITFGDLADYGGEVVPEAVKQNWLRQIVASGGQSGTAGVDAVWGALQVKRVAVQVSSTANVRVNASPGLSELILFGNTDENGSARNLDLAGSTLDGTAYTTVAASFAQPVPLASGGVLSIGASLKYTIGHLLATGDRSTGAATADPLAIRLDFPLVYSDALEGDSAGLNLGNGVGLDLGLAYRSGSLTLSGAVQNVFNSFEWDASRLVYRPTSVSVAGSTRETDTDVQPLEAAPAELRDRIADLKFKPALMLGGALRASRRLEVTADFHMRSKTGIASEPDTHLGAGFEFRPAPWLPLRAGGALISMGDNNSGYQVGGGVGLELGGWNLAFSAGVRNTDRFGSSTRLMATVLSVGFR